MNRSIIPLILPVTLFVFVAGVCHTPALAQVSACQRQCTSQNGPCSSVRSNPGKYDICVAKCQQGCINCGTGTDPTKPDLALNLNELGAACPSNSALGQIKESLTPKLNNLGIQNPDIYPSCQGPNISILIWTTPPLNSCVTQMRQTAPVPTEVRFAPFGFFVSKPALIGLAQSKFNSNPITVPGYPSIHLTHLSLGFLNQAGLVNLEKWPFSCKKSVCGALKPQKNEAISTVVNGQEDRTTPSTDFTVTVLDVLTPRANCSPVADPACGCLSQSWHSTSLLDELLAIVPGLVSGAVSIVLPIAPIANIWEGDLDAAFNQPGGGSVGGASCNLWQSLPDEIALPQTITALDRTISRPGLTRNTGIQRKKIVIDYSESPPTISDDGFTVTGGTHTKLEDRNPVVEVQGPTDLNVNEGSFSTSANYNVLPVPLWAQDFFVAAGSTLSYTWTADSIQTHIASSNQQQTQITFFTDKNMKPGTTTTQTVHVKVTDSEGISASATLTIQLLKLATNPPPPGPSVPGRCKQNPFAKDCPPTHSF